MADLGRAGKKSDSQAAAAIGRRLAQVVPARFNVAELFLDRNLQEGKSAKIAIECGEEQVTYSALAKNANRVGNMLRRLGIRSEERVLLLLPDEAVWFKYWQTGNTAAQNRDLRFLLLSPFGHRYLFNKKGIAIRSIAVRDFRWSIELKWYLD